MRKFERISRAVVDMTEAEIEKMTAGRMAPEHDHLNALLDQQQTEHTRRWNGKGQHQEATGKEG